MTKREDGRFVQTVTINGKRKYFYGRTKHEVLQQIHEYTEAQTEGRTFKAVADDYWRKTESTLSPTTVNPYLRGLNRAVEYFGDRMIKDIQPNEVAQYQDYLIAKWDPAQKTLKNLMIVLNQIFKFGIANGDLTINPAQNISIPKGLRKGKRTIASDEDVKKIIAHRNDCRVAQIGYIALVSGMRRGEILALTHDDINFATGAVKVNKQAMYTSKNQPIIRPPKTEAGNRTAFIPVEFAQNLTNAPFLFSGDKMMGQKQFAKEWHRFCAEIGINCTLHQLRHNFASNLDEAENFTDKEMQYLLGHADVHTTKQGYQELRKGRLGNIAEKLRKMNA